MPYNKFFIILLFRRSNLSKTKISIKLIGKLHDTKHKTLEIELKVKLHDNKI